MKLLHIDSSITGVSSISRTLSSAIVSKLLASNPSLILVRRDLILDKPAHLEIESLSGNGSAAAVASAVILEEFLTADTVVIGAPMYNFTVPSQLKAWIDRILIAGKTFGYGAEGPQGLAGGKHVIIAISRGGFYGLDTGAISLEHVESYLKCVFNFIGIAPEFIVAEGVMAGPDHRASALAKADATIAALVVHQPTPVLEAV